MNSRNTWIWVAVAAALFAFIYFFQHHLQKTPAGPAKILPAVKAAAVGSVQILPQGQLEIRAERTNGVWWLTRPIHYPARAEAIDGLLNVLGHLRAAATITAQEMKTVRHADQVYGFDPPQATIILQQGEEQYFIHVGHRTAPGDQVFLQVVGNEDAYVVDAGLLKLIPNQAAGWRDRNLAGFSHLVFDSVTVTNAGKAYELLCNPSNHLWRIVLPGWETRADRGKVEDALLRLHRLRAEQFVTDDPAADLESFGLQTPGLSLALQRGTNTVLLLEFGKSPTNHADELYARRGDQHTVVTVSKDLLGPWREPYEAFRDRHLVTLTRPLDAIAVHGEDDFTLERQGPDAWVVQPQDFPADPALVRQFITNLTTLQVAEFVKDVVTPPDLPAKGLATPARRYILESLVTNGAAGPTNQVIAELDFGTNQDDKIFARRADESSLYAVKLSDFLGLPSASWQLRNRRIWHFTAPDVASITIHQDGKVREILHKGTNSWSLGPHSQGQINDLAMGEVTHQIGDLSAAVWVERGDLNRADYGFDTNHFQLSIKLKSGRKFSVQFGGTAPSGFPYALTRLDGQPWIFEFPWAIYQYVQLYLTIPVGVP